jgi:hypothetical protein
MKCSIEASRVFAGIIAIAILTVSTSALADTIEYRSVPTEVNYLRGKADRPSGDAVSNWYIYADTQLDGILNPGDSHLNTFNNWWTTVSSGTCNGANRDGAQVNTAPQNHATGNAADNVWIPRGDRSLQFYMSYSQMDNGTVAEYMNKYNATMPNYAQFISDRHKDTDGWNLGWVINDYERFQKGEKLGDFDMDVFVHNGKIQNTPEAAEGTWFSNPQVTASNHMSDLSVDPGPFGGNRIPPKWNEDTKSYDYGVGGNTTNHSYLDWYNDPDPAATGFSPKPLNPIDILTIGQSMEVSEENPTGSTVNDDSVWSFGSERTPSETQALLGYSYQDAFFARHELYENESVGGCIAGLSGYDQYDPEDPYGTYADQQVIRIDLGQEALAQLDNIVIYDFGFDPDASQDRYPPVAIMFGIYDDGGYLRIFYDPNGNGVLDSGEIFMPENRIYIARVDMTPEPMTLALLGFGGLGLLKMRSWRKRA